MKRTLTLDQDFVVIGGGLAGVCAAIAAARQGLRVTLCNNRSVLGGNSSSECRVWVCGAVGMGYNRYASETGIVSELLQENLYRNPEGNPHLWDALLLDKVWAEKNIRLLLETQLTDVRVEDGLVKEATCVQFPSETTYVLHAPLFADCTGDAVLVSLAGGATVKGNQDVCTQSRARFCLDERYASLGSTLLFYSKRVDAPVRFVPPAFAYSVEEIEAALARTGKLISPTDSGCDYWWLEYGGELDVIDDHESIAAVLTQLVYGVWNYIKNSGKYDADHLTLEWVGSMPARRECRRAIARYTFTEDDILSHRPFPDAVCHGGWPIDTHPSSGFFDRRDSCQQIPIDPYAIPLSCLIDKDLPNVLLAGRNAGMTHLAMASARVMMTCAVEGQAIGTAATLARKVGVLPHAFSDAQLHALQARLTRDDVWIPGLRLDAAQDRAQGMRIVASAPLVPDTGAAATFAPLAERACIILPPLSAGTQISLQIRVDDAALVGTPYEISLYESGRLEVYKPISCVQIHAFPLAAGVQTVTLSCTADAKGNVIVSFPACTGVCIGQAAEPLPGVLGTWGESTLGERLFAPAIRLFGADVFYDAACLTDGYTRPYGGMHLWASPLSGSSVTLDAPEPVAVDSCAIYLDNALYRSYNNLRPVPDALWHQHITPQLLRDFTVYVQGPCGHRTFSIRENVQRCVRLNLDGMTLTRLKIIPERTWGASFVSIHEIALFAPEKEAVTDETL